MRPARRPVTASARVTADHRCTRLPSACRSGSWPLERKVVRAVRVDVARSQRCVQAGRPIDVPVAVVTWVVAFVFGQFVSLAIVATSGAETDRRRADPDAVRRRRRDVGGVPGRCYVASKRSGSGDPCAGLGMRLRPIDVVGLPIGVLTQLVLVPARVHPAAGDLAGHVLRGPAVRDRREARRPGERRDDGAARADGLRRRARSSRRSSTAACCSGRSRPARRTSSPGWSRRRGSRSSTSGPSSTRACSPSRSSPAPA